LFEFKFNVQFEIETAGIINYSILDWINNSLLITYIVEIQLGAYYLAGNIANGFTWTTTFSRAEITVVGGEGTRFDGIFSIKKYVSNKNYEIRINLPSMPVSDFVDFRIRVYQPYTNVAAYIKAKGFDSVISLISGVSIRHTVFTLMYLPEDNPPTEEIVLHSTIIEDDNTENIEVINGDGSNTSSLNSYRLSNGLITDAWNRRGKSENEGILLILLKQLRDMRGDYVNILNSSLIGDIDIFNTIEDTTDEIKHYYIQGYDWSIEKSEYNTTLFELGTSDLPLVIVDSSERGLIERGPATPLTSGPIRVGGDEDGGPSEIYTGRKVRIEMKQEDINNYI